jgi:ATP-dependent Clp protease, protease subunit
MRTWYTIKAEAGSDTATVSILDGIGWYGVSARSFITDMKALAQPNIKVEINSPGGDVFDGLAIYNYLINSGKTVTTVALGLAASISSLIFMAGQDRQIASNAFVMVHNPWTGVYGNADELRDAADVLDKIGSSIENTYVARTGMKPEEMKAMLSTDTWMTGQEAIDNGFATALLPEMKLSAAFALDQMPEKVRAAFQAAADAEPKVAQVPAAGFVAQAQAFIAEAGLKDFCDSFLLAHTDMDGVKSAVNAAVEVRDLCAALKVDAAAYIRAGKPLADVRAALIADRAKASGDEINTAPKNESGQPTNTTTPVAVKTADIWARRRKQIENYGVTK